MPGHVQKKKDNYYLVIERGYCPDTGRRRSPQWISVRKELGLNRPAKKGEADKLLNIILAGELQGRPYIAPADISLQEHYDYWLVEHAKLKGLASSTVKQYKFAGRHMCGLLGHVKLALLTPAQIQAALTEKRNDGYSPSSLHAMSKGLNLALKAAVKLKRIKDNPMDSVIKPTVGRPDVEVWSEEELSLFMIEARKHYYYPLFSLAVTTGMRKMEILRLKERHVQRKKNTITVIDAKTTSGWRTINISPATMDMLPGGGEYVFTTSKGKPVAYSMINKVMGRMIKRAGLTHISFHGLRHTYATIMLARGTNPVELAHRLGHSNPSMLWETYGHLIPGSGEKNATMMDDLLLE